jgi:hypothetical protein
MDATWIITAFVLIDTLMERLNHRSDVRAQVPDSDVILVAVLSAKYFQNHHERAVCILRESGYLSAGLMSRALIAVCTSSPIGSTSSPPAWARLD